ncbi:MAG: helix-turn-helix transcriptional regulator, partial [Alphaproteobacteria bacterium]|nr:helix-turn-helix transcriptional regulator [Alphaproteobacteria bacterium]
MTITTAQIRGARGILNWSQGELAERTGISATSIGAIENGSTTPRANTIAVIQKAFEDGGVEFIGLEGIKKKSSYIKILQGYDGFKEFSYDVFGVMQGDGREVLQAYVDDKSFAKWLGDEAYPHVDRMESIKGL